jgi:hypothetical protein
MPPVLLKTVSSEEEKRHRQIIKSDISDLGNKGIGNAESYYTNVSRWRCSGWAFASPLCKAALESQGNGKRGGLLLKPLVQRSFNKSRKWKVEQADHGDEQDYATGAGGGLATQASPRTRTTRQHRPRRTKADHAMIASEYDAEVRRTRPQSPTAVTGAGRVRRQGSAGRFRTRRSRDAHPHHAGGGEGVAPALTRPAPEGHEARSRRQELRDKQHPLSWERSLAGPKVVSYALR